MVTLITVMARAAAYFSPISITNQLGRKLLSGAISQSIPIVLSTSTIFSPADWRSAEYETWHPRSLSGSVSKSALPGSSCDQWLSFFHPAWENISDNWIEKSPCSVCVKFGSMLCVMTQKLFDLYGSSACTNLRLSSFERDSWLLHFCQSKFSLFFARVCLGYFVV